MKKIKPGTAKKREIISKKEVPLYIMLLPGVVIIFIFCYLPLTGLVVAFQRFSPARGLFGNQEWIGLGNFEFVFSLPDTFGVIRNTLIIALGKMVLGLIVPVTVALLLNELKYNRLKRTIQTIIYFPHFISWIVFSAILVDFLSPTTGMVNKFIGLFGYDPVFFLGDNRYFRATIILTDIFKSYGYGTVVYLAAITGIDLNLYEAAQIDGAGRWRQTLHVTLPGMSMIIVLMMILSLGNVLNAGFDQVFNLYNPIVYETGDIIDTMMYRVGLEKALFGPSTAIGFFKSMVSMIFISGSYYISYRFFDYRIF
jgi:putative aldouronate transport system permease protein